MMTEPQLLNRHGNTRVYFLETKHATPAIAQECSRIEFLAYKNRFRELSSRTLENYFHVSSKDGSALLSQFKRQSRYLILTERKRYYVGYGLFELRGNTVFVAEVHTNPEHAQNMRVGTATLLGGLEYAHKKGARRTETWVGRRSLQDPFPYDWFVRMGFSKTSAQVEQVKLGSLQIHRYPMAAPLSRAMPYLNRKLQEFKG